jgi:hypothetical protein
MVVSLAVVQVRGKSSTASAIAAAMLEFMNHEP